MDAEATGRSYDKLAQSWQEDTPVSYGVAQFERAIQFTKNRGHALDIGCGSQGRMMDLLIRHGFQPEGIDVSAEMISLARKRHPGIPFHHADICEWNLPRKYDFISAWDSTWHLPLDKQEPYLEKVCAGLAPNGIYIFTTGGLDEPGEKSNSDMGVPLGYSALGIPKLLDLLNEFGCICRHLEYDQYPEQYLVIIAQKS
jgi:SAM-dependent methyltransferase